MELPTGHYTVHFLEECSQLRFLLLICVYEVTRDNGWDVCPHILGTAQLDLILDKLTTGTGEGSSLSITHRKQIRHQRNLEVRHEPDTTKECYIVLSVP